MLDIYVYAVSVSPRPNLIFCQNILLLKLKWFIQTPYNLKSVVEIHADFLLYFYSNFNRESPEQQLVNEK